MSERAASAPDSARDPAAASPPPPVRVDHVGPLIPPPAFVEALRRLGGLDAARVRSPEALAEAEDAALRDLVRLQRDSGLPVIGDGALRRAPAPWAEAAPFLLALDGVTPGADGAPALTAPPTLPDDAPVLAEARALVLAHRGRAGLSLPAPDDRGLTLIDGDGLTAELRDPDGRADALVAAWRAAVAALHGIGLRDLRLDAPAFGPLRDPARRRALQAEGRDPDREIDRLARLIGAALAGRPADLRVAVHLPAAGVPDPDPAAALRVLERLADAGIDALLLTPDVDGPAGLAPLRALAESGPRVLLGLVSATDPRAEKVDPLRRRLDAAAEIVDLDRLGLATSAGFVAPAEGEPGPGFDDQRRKLDLLAETTERVWGDRVG